MQLLEDLHFTTFYFYSMQIIHDVESLIFIITSKWELSVSHHSSSENVLPHSCSRLFASVRQDSDALLISEANH